MDENELKELLTRENPDFRRALEEHRTCETALEALKAKPFLTEGETIEEKELKKRKLALKDRMYQLMLSHGK
jgi:uncharacterized protein YdcH (DUF465 family)